MTAKFIIKETFKITGRGFVLAGSIDAGEISVGDFIVFNAFNKKVKRKIIGVNGIRNSNPDQTNTGLLIQCENESEIDELRQWQPKDSIGLVTKD